MTARSAALAVVAMAAGACSGGVDVGTRADPVVYTAEVDPGDVAGPSLPESFSGRWALVLEGDRYRLEQETFGSVTEAFSVRDGELRIHALPAPRGAFNCYRDGKRVLEEVEARYEVRPDGDGIVLEAREDPCPLRADILSRRWRGAG